MKPADTLTRHAHDDGRPVQRRVKAAEAEPIFTKAARSIFDVDRLDPVQEAALAVLPQLGAEVTELCHEDAQKVIENMRREAAHQEPTKGDQPRSERGREGMEPQGCESATGRGADGAPALATLPHYERLPGPSGNGREEGNAGAGHAEGRPDPTPEFGAWTPLGDGVWRSGGEGFAPPFRPADGTKPPRFAFDNQGRLTIDAHSCAGVLTPGDARELVRYLALFSAHPAEEAA